MSMWINYHHLYYFWTIAEEGSVSKAAVKLRLGQPTLSAQLKQFEDSLGVQLFERHHKRLALTEQGEVAREYARTIFRTGSEMVEALHDRLKPSRPSLSLGSLDSVPKQIMCQLVKHALKIAPCQITLREGSPTEMIRELTAHRLDLYLTNFLPNGLEARGLYHRLIAKNQVSIFGAPKFRTLRKNFPHSISNQPIILPTYDSKLRYDLDNWSKSQNASFDVITESQEIAVKKLLAVDGIGLIATASHTVTSQVLEGTLLEIGKLDGVFEELYLVAANRKIANAVAARLLKEFQI